MLSVSSHQREQRDPLVNLKATIKQCKSVRQLYQVHAHTITTGLLSLHPSLYANILHIFTILASTPIAAVCLPPISYPVFLFSLIPKPSAFCYNTIIRAHTLLSSPIPALRFFTQMRRLSVSPDFHTFPFAVKASSLLHAAPLAAALQAQAFKFGFTADLFVQNSLIHAYSISGRLPDAQRVFDEASCRDVVSYNTLIDGFVKAGQTAPARNLFDTMPAPDSVSWGTLLTGYARMDQCFEAIQLFNQMLALRVHPDNISLVSALSACAQLGELQQGCAIHDFITRNRIPIDAFLSTALVDLYAKCGCIDTAKKIFDASLHKNLCSWNALLVGLAMHGHGRLSLVYFFEMVESGIRPDGVSFLGVLVGCSHAGLLDEARQLFDQMETSYGVPRELKHYGCMADLLGRAGLIAEAIHMIKEMPMQGDLFVWSGLLAGCRIHGNVEIAEKAAEHVMALNPEDGGVYSIMANVYANAERWDDVLKIRKCMSIRRIKKNAGCSLIQLKGITHEFVAGDTLHPQTYDIYCVLNGIGKHQFEAC